MGIAKVLQSLGFKKQADASLPVDVVPGEAGQLVDIKKDLELKKDEIEQQLAKVDHEMASTPLTTQIQGETTMDPIKEPVVPAAEEKLVPPAVAPETPAAAPALAPTASVETKAEEKAEEKKEDKKEEEGKKESSFAIRFAEGKTFEDSYFVAEDKGEFRAVKASRIIPAHIQAKILKCLATTGKPPEDIITPTDIIDQMTGQGVNTLETFETAAVALEAQSALMAKTAGLMAWNESEVKTEKGDPKRPLSAVSQSEFEAGKKLHPVPSGTGSKVKQYYGRLPSAAGGEPTLAIAQSSTNVKDKIDFMRRALEEMKAQKDAAEDKAKKAEDKVGVMEKGNEDKESAGLMESIVKDLLAKKLISAKDESAAVAALAKIERKNLAHVAALLKLLGKSEEAKAPAIGADAKPAPFGGAKANPFGAEQHPKASVTLPPTFLNENEPEMGNGSAFLAKYWDAR